MSSIEASSRPWAEHSSACQDGNSFDYDDEYIGECCCRPNADEKPPDAYELWWCEWCGQETAEGSDPCQECGTAATRRRYVAVDEVEALLRDSSRYFSGDHVNAGVAIGDVRRRLRALTTPSDALRGGDS